MALDTSLPYLRTPEPWVGQAVDNLVWLSRSALHGARITYQIVMDTVIEGNDAADELRQHNAAALAGFVALPPEEQHTYLAVHDPGIPTRIARSFAGLFRLDRESKTN